MKKTPPGPDFFRRASKQEIEELKASMIRSALEDNAKLPPDKRRPEEVVIGYEKWCFNLFGI